MRFRVVTGRGTEVYELDVALVRNVDNDVLGLQISMSHVLSVAVCDGPEDLLNNNGSLHLGEAITIFDLVEELAPWRQLRHEIDLVPILVHLVQLDNVRVRQSLEGLHFLLHQVLLLIGHGKFVDHLDCA